MSGQSSGSQWGETFTIDAWGNLTNRAGITGKTNTELLNAAPATVKNQLNGFCNDSAGNLVLNTPCPQPPGTPFTPTYYYDAENRLVWTTGYRYNYDGDGQRVEKCQAAGATSATPCPTSGTAGTIYWRGTGSDSLYESDLAGNPQEEYIYFNGQRIARRDVTSTGATIAMHYYFSDHLGSHGVVENATGTVCEQDIDYYPYGGVENDYCSGSGVAQHYKFTGKERDSESGLDNFGFRYYGSPLGRFMSADDGTDQVVDNPQSWNLYSYVRNNPLRYTDPDGHDCIHINTDTGKFEGFDSGDCDNSTEEKANSGIYVDGTINTLQFNSSAGSLDFGYTDANGNVGAGTILSVAQPGPVAPINDPGMIPGMLGPGDLILLSGVKLPSVVTDAVGKLVGSILGKGAQQGAEQTVELTTHAATRLGQRGITQAAVDQAVQTAKAAGQVTTQMGKYGTEQLVYKGTNGITVVVETQGSNAGKAITVFQTGSKP
jgi:RHS repeat-associated protein